MRNDAAVIVSWVVGLGLILAAWRLFDYLVATML